MSRFPLTSTPARAAMLARCMFGNGSAADDGTRRDDPGPGSPDPQTGGADAIAGMTDPAENEALDVRPPCAPGCATSG